MPTKRAKRGTKPRSKASAQYLHAKRRALERYGIELTKDSYTALCKDIQNGIGVCLGKQSNRLTVWRINVLRPESLTRPGPAETVPCHVVYDKTRHRIVTFLPADITDAKGVSLVDTESAT